MIAMNNYKIKVVPSTEKCFFDDSFESKKGISRLSMLKNERLSFQTAYTFETSAHSTIKWCKLKIDSPLSDKISVYRVENVPVSVPAYPWETDKGYLRYEPGLFPDLLAPQDKNMPVPVTNGMLLSLLFTVEDEEGIEPGDYKVKIALEDADEVAECEINITVIDEMLPEQELIHTQWFHCDCLATYYGCEVYSERHFELIGNYMEAAARCGVNMIFIPVFSLSVDVGDGCERPVTQLVDVTLTDGKYSFGYETFDRFVKLATEKGMKYFEIAHFFSQGGAKSTGRVMGTVDGEYREIFGRRTDAINSEYPAFLRCFAADFAKHLRTLGIADRCYFHISDEPHISQLEQYTAAKNTVADILSDFKFMDALSDYEFYESGAVDTPVPGTNFAEPFIENNVPDLWVYYCNAQHTDVSNRFIAMPGERTRVFATQLFKYNIAGFLHWGFNFWSSHSSVMPVNPYLDTCGCLWTPAGDTFSVYPGADGRAVDSLHSLHLYEALQDLRAMRLLESRIGHDAVVAILEEGISEPITFKQYPVSAEYLLGMREKINSALAKKA